MLLFCNVFITVGRDPWSNKLNVVGGERLKPRSKYCPPNQKENNQEQLKGRMLKGPGLNSYGPSIYWSQDAILGTIMLI